MTDRGQHFADLLGRSLKNWIRGAVMPLSRKMLLLTVSAILAVGGILASGAPPAAASASDCDASGRPMDAYGLVGSGVSFVYAGRKVYLANGRLRNYSYGVIKAGYVAGDRIWVDRSKNKMPRDITYPTTDQVRSKGGGWKQCGPFNNARSGSVINWDTKHVKHYAARVCIDHPRKLRYHCGRWYTDAH